MIQRKPTRIELKGDDFAVSRFSTANFASLLGSINSPHPSIQLTLYYNGKNNLPYTNYYHHQDYEAAKAQRDKENEAKQQSKSSSSGASSLHTGSLKKAVQDRIGYVGRR
jgi:hypothetical protein